MNDLTSTPFEQPRDAARRHGVVAVVVRERHFLVIRRSATVVAPGKLCFPGGAIEADETEPAALVREFQEELNAPITPLARVWRSATRWGVDLAWWSGTLTHDANLRANPAEVESFVWLTAEQMLSRDNLLESNREFLAELTAGSIRLPVA